MLPASLFYLVHRSSIISLNARCGWALLPSTRDKSVFQEFVAQNLFLFIALAVILVLLAANIVIGSIYGGAQVSPTEVTNLINRDAALVLDVRDHAEFATGHILDALSFPLKELKERFSDLAKHRGRPIVINSRAGTDAVKAAKLLKKAGIEKVYRLQGGMLAWQNANLPLAKGATSPKELAKGATSLREKKVRAKNE